MMIDFKPLYDGRVRIRRDVAAGAAGVLVLAAGTAMVVHALSRDPGQRPAATVADERTRLEREHSEIASRAADLEVALAVRTAELAEARHNAERFRVLYEKAAPAPVQRVLQEALRRIEAGVAPERIGITVDQAREAGACAPAIVRKLLVRTPLNDGPGSQTRIDEILTLAVSGSGAENGRAAWYDPEREVTVSFGIQGAGVSPLTGRLPLQHNLVLKGREYRLLLARSSRGYLELRSERCEGAPPRKQQAGMP